MYASAEQTEIINTLKNGNNAMVNAIPGSGKTTTVLYIAKACPNYSILQVTYNSQLKHEVRLKVKKHKLKNLEIQTYHSFMTTYYSPGGYTDPYMKYVIENDKNPVKSLKKYDLIVIDEVQDMQYLFYKFMKKVLKDHGDLPLILILGDNRQNIYEFQGADVRYLTLADFIFPIRKNTFFNKLQLSTSYRITKSMAWFVNNVISAPDAPQIYVEDEKCSRVKIITLANIFQDIHVISTLICDMIFNKNNNIHAQDIFILAPSVANRSGKTTPLQTLENMLVDAGILVNVPINDEATLDDDVIRGKLCITTYHQSKGRERPIVFVFGFDNDYITFNMDKDIPLPTCAPPAMFVACTRAQRRLFLIESGESGRLCFLRNLDNPDIHTYCKFIQPEGFVYKNTIPKEKIDPIKYTVTNIIRFIDQSLFEKDVDDIFDIHVKPTHNIKFKNYNKICTNEKYGLYESVADLNGIAIPAMLDKDSKIYGEVVDYMRKTDIIIEPPQNISDWLYISNIYMHISNGYKFKIKQIPKYTWFNDSDVIQQCHDIIINSSGNCYDSITYEKRCEKQYEYSDLNIIGIVDADDGEVMWEYKCTESLTIEHKLQLILYAWINSDEDRIFKLLNIRTGEIYGFKPNADKINAIVKKLIDAKKMKITQINDQEFINKCIVE